MADFTTPNLQGANEKLNKALTDATALKDKLLAEHGGEASSILSTLQSAVADLVASLGSLIPELPEIPNVNMQSDFTQLANFDITTPEGLASFEAQKASIEAQFGDALSTKGIDLDSVASQMNSLSLEDATAQIGKLTPNLQLPAGETTPVELSAAISQASEQAVEEAKNVVDKENVTVDVKEITVEEIEIIEDGESRTEKREKYTIVEKTSGGGETFIQTEETPEERDAKKRWKTKTGDFSSPTGDILSDEGVIQKFYDAKITSIEQSMLKQMGILYDRDTGLPIPDYVIPLPVHKIKRFFEAYENLNPNYVEWDGTEEGLQVMREACDGDIYADAGPWAWRGTTEWEEGTGYTVLDERYYARKRNKRNKKGKLTKV
tara:strand:- start:1516 stop:2649 length:1134 start_codon:yes stop_codon:yes gene_type:complete